MWSALASPRSWRHWEGEGEEEEEEGGIDRELPTGISLPLTVSTYSEIGGQVVDSLSI